MPPEVMEIWSLQHHCWEIFTLQIESEFIQAFKLPSFCKKCGAKNNWHLKEANKSRVWVILLDNNIALGKKKEVELVLDMTFV